MIGRWFSLSFIFSMVVFVSQQNAAELVRLTPKTWDKHIPQGKEVDAIHGDYVLRNGEIVCVVAQPLNTRNANMTVRGVGGMIIDLTRRNRQSDQLSAFYAGGSLDKFTSPKKTTLFADQRKSAASGVKITNKSVSVQFDSTIDPALSKSVKYTLADGQPYIIVESTYKLSDESKPVTIPLRDAMRADRTFAFGTDAKINLYWAYDEWFRQAYGIVVEGYEIRRSGGRGVVLDYVKEGEKEVELKPGETFTIKRSLFPGDDLLHVRAVANQIAGVAAEPVSLLVRDPAGAVKNAKVTVAVDKKTYASGRTPADGKLAFELPHGKYQLTVEALGRPAKTFALDTSHAGKLDIELDACGYVVGAITDEKGGPIPCKVAFHGIDGTESPFYGPDSAAGGVQNVYYTHNGKFREEIGPGKYEVIISRGPEYDAVTQTISVQAGQDTKIAARLERVVDTAGWISTEYHSHSSPSGDNSGSQFGRVLNLLCEHLEFAPCTEHNRIDTYTPHLKRLGSEHLMATCTGMELTGQPLPANHQNAFPLIHKPRTQDGGGPVTDLNPEVQIERLAMWDNKSDKLVQGNHPNIHQILGDKDTDGKPDAGFRKMLGFMDVIEVHPPAEILVAADDEGFKTKRNPMFQWMQLLNLGYRITGVVNTDAHYNYHGSGWLRNYVKSTTDDPAKVKTMDMVHTSERGNVVMTTGPFMEVSLRSLDSDKKDKPPTSPGDDAVAKGGKVELSIRVQCSNWLDVNRVQVFVNGRASKHNLTRRTTPDKFNNGVVKFDQKLTIELEKDAHVIVAAAGEGLELGRVMGPRFGKQMPIAVSNPIFVDVDGGGFKPNEDDLGMPLPLQ